MNLKSEDIEKVKALELSNFIDNLEQNMLGGEESYYKKTGKDAIFNPQKKDGGALIEIQKLEREINKKERELDFGPAQNGILEIIKNKKLDMIRKNFSSHETKQIQEWINKTFDEAIELSIKKAVFHRDNEGEIQISVQNGKSAILEKAKINNYQPEDLGLEISLFEERAISMILESYIREGNLKAIDFLNNHKDKLGKDKIKKYEKETESIQKSFSSKNLANRIFNLYSSSKEKAFEELKNEKGDKEAKNLLEGLFSSKEKNEENEQNSILLKAFQEISKTQNENAPLSYDLIPYELNEKNKNDIRSYLEKLMKGEEIQTSAEEFLSLFEIYRKNPLAFPKFNFIKYKMFLSDYDFRIFLRLADEAKTLTLSEAMDTVNLISEEISDFGDGKKVQFIRYFLDNLYLKSREKAADYEEKKEIIKKTVRILGGKKGLFEGLVKK